MWRCGGQHAANSRAARLTARAAMRLRLRLLILLIRAWLLPQIGFLDASVLSMTALLNDVDIGSVTNDRYLAFMDLGRIDWIVRCGLFKACVRGRYAPVVRFMSIRYTYPARLFQRFELHSRVLFWDAEWVWFEQRFVRHGRTLAVAHCKGCLKNKDGIVPTSLLMAQSGHPPMPSPEPSELILSLERMEAAQRAS
ncbi:MAG: thioesterase [Rubrivivax sp.]|nr:MAG: thioesterase [Rubrivivax sp.]